MTFIDEVMDGSATEESLDAHVATWEQGSQDYPISQHLGLTADEFFYLCLEGNFDTVMKNIQLNRNNFLH